jgi:probable HAF family extracellular repeat protein
MRRLRVILTAAVLSACTDGGFPPLLSEVTITDLGTLGGAHSEPEAVNDLGQVVGMGFTAGDSFSHAFLWQNGSMTGLGTLGGTYSRAMAINAIGQVVGLSTVLGDTALWQNGTMADLGTLGGAFSTAVAVNNLGQVAGSGGATQSAMVVATPSFGRMGR